eukprot:m.246031 g.246031  ORF g.246031 m.246031 type:complete len:3452 (-) comp26641_c0_seq2:27-10382(-)
MPCELGRKLWREDQYPIELTYFILNAQTGNYFVGIMDQLLFIESAISDVDVINTYTSSIPDTLFPQFGPNGQPCVSANGFAVDDNPQDKKFSCQCLGVYSDDNCRVPAVSASFSFDSGDFEDSIGNLKGTCSLTTCPSFDVGVASTYAVKFDGASDLLGVGGASVLGLNNSSFAITAWLRPRSDGSIVETDDGLLRVFLAGSQLAVTIGTTTRVHSHSVLADNTWAHIGVSYTKHSRQLDLFVNALIQPSSRVDPFSGTADISIGRGFRGTLDTLVFWQAPVTISFLIDIAMMRLWPDTHRDYYGPNHMGCLAGVPNDAIPFDQSFECACPANRAGANCQYASGDPCAAIDCSSAPLCHTSSCVNGQCILESVLDFTPCDDGNDTTSLDYCSQGSCVGVDLCEDLTCIAKDQCHVVGTCLRGVCSNPPVWDGTPCNDQSNLTVNDMCVEGICVGVAFVPDPIHWWSFDANTGNHVADNVDSTNGDNNPGVLTNALSSSWTKGICGNAVHLSFLQGYPNTITLAKPIDAEVSFSIVFWVTGVESIVGDLEESTVVTDINPLSSTIFSATSSDPSTSFAGVIVAVGSNGVLVVEDTVLTRVILSWAGNFSTNCWHQVALIVDRGQPMLFINETLVHSGQRSSEVLSLRNQELEIGSGKNFRGVVDELHVYRVALSSVQVSKIFSKLLYSDPISHWPLNERSGKFIADIALHPSPGTKIAGQWTMHGKIRGGMQMIGTGVTAKFANSKVLDSVCSFSFWALPADVHEIDQESTIGSGGSEGQKFIVCPPQVDSLCISLGVNGLSLYQRQKSQFPALLVFVSALTSWTAISLSVSSISTQLYINGDLVQTSLPPSSPFYCSVDALGVRGSAYEGSVDDLRLYARELNPSEIRKRYLRDQYANPVHAWTFESMVGPYVLDAAAVRTNALLDNMDASALSVGRVGQAIKFSGPSTLRLERSPSTELWENFTISLWVKPSSTQEQIDAERKFGRQGLDGRASYVLFPYQGSGNFSTLALSVGNNGVSVYEYGYRHFPALLVWPQIIQDWTFIAVAVDNNRPQLYVSVDDKLVLVREGLQSTKRIGFSPLIMGADPRGRSQYQGFLDEVTVFAGAMTPVDLQSWYQQQAHRDPVAYYKFDEEQGSVAVDSTWAQNNGTMYNVAAANFVPGFIGWGLSFNGNPTYARATRVAPHRNLLLSEDFSINFWCLPRSVHEIDLPSQTQGGAQNQRYAFAPVQSNYINVPHAAGAGVSVGTNGVAIYELTTGKNIPLALGHEADISSWTMITVTYERNVPSLFLDGQRVATGTMSPHVVHAIGNIGTDDQYGAFKGNMDEIRVYDRALSQDEIVHIFQTDSVKDQNPVGEWNFEEGRGTSALDSGSFNKHLLFNNAMLSSSARQLWVPGKVGRWALAFDLQSKFSGSNVQMAMVRKPTAFAAGEFTISFWAKPIRTIKLNLPQSTTGRAGMNGQAVVINGLRTNSPNYVTLLISVGTNGIACILRGQNEQTYALPLIQRVSLTEWSFITVVVQDNTPSLYVGDTWLTTGLKSPLPVYLWPLALGARWDNPFRGTLDNVRFFRFALSAPAISKLYDRDRKEGTVLSWPMDAPSGFVMIDHVSSSNGSFNGNMSDSNRVRGKVLGGLAFNVNGNTGQFVTTLKSPGLSIKTNFTFTVWVLPHATHQIDPQGRGNRGRAGQRFAITPTNGNRIGPDAAGVGVSVGINGISVYENARGYTPALLVWQGDVSQWTCVTVVYMNNQPSLYINGQFVKQGVPSSKTSYFWDFATIGGGPYGDYIGVLDELRVWTRTLTVEEVFQVYTQDLDQVECPPDLSALPAFAIATCKGDLRVGGDDCHVKCLPGYIGGEAWYSCDTNGQWLGDLSCEPCAAGTSQVSADVCQNCTAGAYVPAASVGNCTQHLCSPGTVDDDLNPSTPCRPCRSGISYQNLPGQTQCLPVTECPPGMEEIQPPSLFTNRLCRSCAPGYWKPSVGQMPCKQATACVLQFESFPATPTSDRACADCPSNTYLSVSGTCVNVTLCHPGTQQVQSPSPTSDRTCEKCPSNSFNPSVGGRCRPHSTCEPRYQYEQQASTLVTDRVCQNLTVCSIWEFQDLAATATSDRVCDACTVCLSGSSMTKPCTTTQDRECTSCRPCTADTYETSACTPTSNRQCHPCSVCGPDQFEAFPCTQRDDRVCKPLSNCTESQFQLLAASSKADRICRDLSQCKDGNEYQMAPATKTTDRVCAPLTRCRIGQELAVLATPTSDRECRSCPFGATDDDNNPLTRCRICGRGHFVPAGASGDCSLYRCQPGFYDDDELASTICKPCPDDSYQPLSGASDCRPVRVCGVGEEQVVDSTHFTDRICLGCLPGYFNDGNHTKCVAVHTCDIGEEEWQEPTPTSDRLCRPCNAITNYQDQAGQKRCKPVTGSCPPGQHPITNPTSTSDRMCASCPEQTFKSSTSLAMCASCTTSCAAGFFLATPCEPTVDAACIACPLGTFSNPSNMTAVATSCQPITSGCPTGQYLSDVGSATFDSTCSACKTCPPGYYKIGGCIHNQDTECLPCLSSCPRTNEILVGECQSDALVGPRCVKCSGACASCRGTGSNDCLTCIASFHLHEGHCISVCPNGKYSINGTCTSCHHTCAECTGPASDQCIACRPGTFLYNNTCLSSCAVLDGFYADVELGLCRQCRVCTPGTFESKTCGIFQDAICTTWTSCNNFEYELASGTATSDRRCSKCSACPPGQFALPGGCSGSQDTVCGSCELPDFFQDRSGQTTCKRVQSCLSGFYVTRAPTSTSDRQCTACPPETWQHVPNQDQCMPATQCDAGEEETTPLGPFTDRVCRRCVLSISFKTKAGPGQCTHVRQCAPGTQETAAPTLTSDRLCEECPNQTYQDQTGRLTCLRASSCVRGQYVSSPLTKSSDRVCAECLPKKGFYQDELNQEQCKRLTDCEPGQYEALAALADQNRLCLSCHPFNNQYQDQKNAPGCKQVTACTTEQYETTPPTATSNRRCTSATICGPGTYEVTKLTPSSDRKCASHSVCGDQEYELSPATTLQDRTCAPISRCRGNWIETTAPTPTTDRTCGTDVIVVFNADFDQVFSSTSKQERFKDALIQSLRLENIEVTPSQISLKPGSILATIFVVNEQQFTNLQLAVQRKYLVVYFDGRSFVAFPASESSSFTPQQSTTSSDSNNDQIWIWIVIGLVVLLVVLVALFVVGVSRLKRQKLQRQQADGLIFDDIPMSTMVAPPRPTHPPSMPTPTTNNKGTIFGQNLPLPNDQPPAYELHSPSRDPVKSAPSPPPLPPPPTIAQEEHSTESWSFSNAYYTTGKSDVFGQSPGGMVGETTTEEEEQPLQLVYPIDSEHGWTESILHEQLDDDDEVQERLWNPAVEDGTFLAHKNGQDFVVSVIHKGQIIHHNIEEQDGVWHINSVPVGHKTVVECLQAMRQAREDWDSPQPLMCAVLPPAASTC